MEETTKKYLIGGSVGIPVFAVIVFVLSLSLAHSDYLGLVNNKSLPDDWVIHHINGIRNDNRPENLLGLPKYNHHYALKMQAQQGRIRKLEAEIKKLKSQPVMAL